MSFWNGVKRAFGFSHEPDDEDEEYASGLPVYAVNRPAPVAPTPIEPRAAATPQPSAVTADAAPQDTADSVGDVADGSSRPEADASLPADILDTLIDILRDQREAISGAISDKLVERVNAATRSAATGSRAEEAAMRRRIDSLEHDLKDTEKLRADNNKLRLSLERQKRALLDRINDLEAQVARLNAEKDRFFTDRHARRAAAQAAEAPAPEASAENAEAIEKLNARVAELEAEVKRQTTLREQLEVKSRMSDEMISSTRNDAARVRAELEQANSELEQANADKEEALQLIKDQLEGAEQLKARLQGRINDLQEQLKAEQREDREARIASLTEENASLRHTIENNLYNQANSEMKLRAEIKDLRARLDAAPAAPAAAPAPVEIDSTAAPAPEPRPARRRGRPKKARIDSELDNTEWFSPSGSSSAPRKDDPDFGYHEPPRRPANDNEAQLSLF